jgi:capsular exopolysaccharide synthesis family protein
LKNDGKDMIDLRTLISLLLGKLWLIILMAVLGGAAAFCFSKFAMPLKYSSHISMYVQSYTGISENVNNPNNISNSKQLVNTYIEVLKDDAVMNAVAEELRGSFDNSTLAENFSIVDGRITPSSLRDCITITSVTDTSALKLSAVTKNAEISAAICNDIAKVAPEYLQEAVGVGQINTIDTAKVYNSPVAPNVKKNAMLGFLAAAMLTALAIIAVDFFDNTVKDTVWLGGKFNKPIIGEIQQFEDEKKRKKNAEDSHTKLTDKNVPFSVVESYKSIRTNITFALSTTEKKIFTVSSANPAEGKSTTSANIAIALAQGGNKVLLVDGDLRKSCQHKIFGIKNKKGLSSAIGKMASVEECISRNVMENLDVMSAGPTPPNPSELLASDNMEAILSDLSEKYSVIIIDAPPVNVVTDAMELANKVSGIIMVTRYGKTTTDDIDNAMSKIEFAKMNMLGFILNDIKVGRGGKYYSKYKYDKNYGYGSSHSADSDDEEEKPVEKKSADKDSAKKKKGGK